MITITIEEYVDEIEGELEHSNVIIDMLKQRLGELRGDLCTCSGCVLDYRNEHEEGVH